VKNPILGGSVPPAAPRSHHGEGSPQPAGWSRARQNECSPICTKAAEKSASKTASSSTATMGEAPGREEQQQEEAGGCTETKHFYKDVEDTMPICDLIHLDKKNKDQQSIDKTTSCTYCFDFFLDKIRNFCAQTNDVKNNNKSRNNKVEKKPNLENMLNHCHSEALDHRGFAAGLIHATPSSATRADCIKDRRRKIDDLKTREQVESQDKSASPRRPLIDTDYAKEDAQGGAM
jgi:hypothetical protein